MATAMLRFKRLGRSFPSFRSFKECEQIDVLLMLDILTCPTRCVRYLLHICSSPMGLHALCFALISFFKWP